MNLPEQPKSMIIVGSGAIGVEFGYFYNSMGTEVTIVEFLPNVVPLEDEEVSKQFERSLKKSKIKVMTNSSVTKVDTSGEGVTATVSTKKGDQILEADVILSAVGIKSNIENILAMVCGMANHFIVSKPFSNSNCQQLPYTFQRRILCVLIF